MILVSLVSLLFAIPAAAQEVIGPLQPMPLRVRIPVLNGTWYLAGDPNQHCQIRQRWGGDRALFVNEQGSEALGVIRGDRVVIPSWGDNGQGLEGVIQGDRIVWPDGNFWSR
jgi:hypothetical protein